MKLLRLTLLLVLAVFIVFFVARSKYTGQVSCTADVLQCPDGSYVGRSGPKCEFKCSSTSTIIKSGITGTVFLGPMCGNMPEPIDATCQPKPLQIQLNVIDTKSDKMVMEFNSDTNGRFKISLNPGEYVIKRPTPENGAIFPPICVSETISVTKDNITEVIVNCDSGIR